MQSFKLSLNRIGELFFINTYHMLIVCKFKLVFKCKTCNSDKINLRIILKSHAHTNNQYHETFVAVDGHDLKSDRNKCD